MVHPQGVNMVHLQGKYGAARVVHTCNRRGQGGGARRWVESESEYISIS
jgi:hypothetical protein